MFEQSHREWLEQHIRRRSGERRRRLQDGHQYAEREMLRHVWWPAFGHLDYLHPEFEVTDFGDGPRFIDFAYIRAGIRLAIEVDGYGPHVRDLSRRQFCDQWVRQMHLLNDGWMVMRIGYDDVRERPRLWQQLLQQMMGRLFADGQKPMQEADCVEKEIVRLALRLGRPLKLQDVRELFGCGYRYARKRLDRLKELGWLIPESKGTERTHTWRVTTYNESIGFRFCNCILRQQRGT